MITGTLFLIPNTLGDLSRESQFPWVLPPEIIQQASQIEFLDC
jgi:16S rRNA (cytidine1402-2'-O)-methyltransferase